MITPSWFQTLGFGPSVLGFGFWDFGFENYPSRVQQIETIPALTRLSQDEALFRDSVYEFADREIRPHVREMDEHAKISRALIDKLFELGVMGIEIPDAYGGGGLVARGSVHRGAGGRTEHPRHQRLAPLGQRRGQAAVSGADGGNHHRC